MRIYLRISIGTLLLTSLFTKALDCESWEWNNPKPHGNHIHDVSHDGFVFRAVCDHGIVMVSEYGFVWDIKLSGNSRALKGIAHGPATMVVVGEDGINYHSSDGDTWVPGANLGVDLESVAYGNGMFVAVGSSGMTFRSTSGITWQTQSTAPIALLSDIIFDGNSFLAVGSFGTLCTSTDAINWTVYTSIAGVVEDLSDIEYIHGKYVVTGSSGTVCMSDNGTSWTYQSISGAGDLNESYYFAGLFYVMGKHTYSSPDGNTWEQEYYFGSSVAVMSANGSQLVAVGNGGGTFTSTDGDKWSRRSGLIHTSIEGATYGDGNYLVVSGGSSIKSTNGESWHPRQISSATSFKEVIYSHGMFITVGGGGRIYTSPHGDFWTMRDTPSQTNLTSLISNGNTVVAVGHMGLIMYSSDGIQWDLAEFEPGVVVEDYLMDVAFGASGLFFLRFVAVGTNGCILTSVDGVTWDKPDDSGMITETLNSVASRGDLFVACGSNGKLLYSHYGSSWFEKASATALNLLHVYNESEGFRAVGEQGMMLTSPDGQLWIQEPLYISGNLYASAINGSQQLMFGSYGAILKRMRIYNYLGNWPYPDNILDLVEIQNELCGN